MRQPLTSAVNDAEAFRETIVELGLVDEDDVTLICSPAREAGAPEATKRTILNALRPYYEDAGRADRLFFYYAGHGLLAYADAAHGESRTAIVPVDVENLDTDGDALIDVDALLKRFRLAGPREQFFFIDACRDLAFERHPDVGRLGWTAVDGGAPRAQAVLYAVAERGQALGQAGENGVMSLHLNDALRGQGIALDYSEELEQYVVTAQSVRNYVRKRVEETISGDPLWRKKYMLPELAGADPQPAPIRVMEPPAAALTIHIAPDEAAQGTSVVLSQRGNELQGFSWPPNVNHAPVALQPQRYTILATATNGVPEPARCPIDLREETEATIEIRPPGAVTLGMGPELEAGPSSGSVAVVFAPRSMEEPSDAPPSPSGVVVAQAHEPESVIELVGLEPPYERWSARHELREPVPAGRYRIEFRLGSEVFSSREIDVDPGKVLVVSPTTASSPLLRDMLGEREPRPTVELSETIGPMQGAVLPTMLAMVGIKPFDRTGRVFRRFAQLVRPADPARFERRPVSIVLALEGDRWSHDVSEILARIACVVESPGGRRVTVPLEPLHGPPEKFGRVRLGIVAAPDRTFTVQLDSPHLGRVRLASASLPDRATVVGLAFTSDGSFELSQNLLRFPGREYPREPVPHVEFARMLRELQLGQRLYASGELLIAPDGLIRALIYAKWTDPLLSCMAFFAARDAARFGDDKRAGRHGFETAARNLVKFFGDVPDSRVVHALTFPETAVDMLGEILARDEIPILRRSALALAEHARAQGMDDSAAARAARAASPHSIWSMEWLVADESLPFRKPRPSRRRTSSGGEHGTR